MVNKVIKKSGKKEKFDPKKIMKCVGEACKGAKIPKVKIKKVEDEILKEVIKMAEERELTTAEIRDIVLRDLHALDPAVARAWIAFEILKIQRRKKKLME